MGSCASRPLNELDKKLFPRFTAFIETHCMINKNMSAEYCMLVNAFTKYLELTGYNIATSNHLSHIGRSVSRYLVSHAIISKNYSQISCNDLRQVKGIALVKFP